MPHLITDPADPRITAYLNLRDRDLADLGTGEGGHGGRFIAEGEVVLRVLATRGRFAVESVLIDAKREAALAPILSALAPEVPVYLAGRAVLDAIVGFPLHRGILAVGLRQPDPDPAALLASVAEGEPVLGLVGIANHDNMGGILRNAAAFGVRAVLMDETCCDPLYRKAIRTSVGGALVVPWTRVGSGLDMVGVLEAAGFCPIGLSPAGADDLADLARLPRPALILGAEGPGLPDAVLARARAARIPMRADFDSLNVSTTSGIALYALTRRPG
ncbi:TrmH family RNA methyltransferase [Radicibacter daui]|uniref:TrmH family RNA methyltransferase n=1 Tax=Radicibacter daui TaxID=3064829 RepID=UPI0040468FBA